MRNSVLSLYLRRLVLVILVILAIVSVILGVKNALKLPAGSHHEKSGCL